MRSSTTAMLAVLLIGQFMALLDVNIVNLAMPTISTDLHASGAQLQLVVAGYTISYAMLLMTGARLGHVYGRRRLFTIGLAVFTGASLACGFSVDSPMLIGLRFVQGAGAALMIPQVISTIHSEFAGPAKTRALSAYAAVLASGSVAGQVIGGVLVNADLLSGWRPAFLVNVPIGLALLAFAPRALPADVPSRAARLDLPGLVIATAAVCAVVLPLVLGHDQGWPAWTFASMAAGVVLAVVFVLVERAVAQRGGAPLLNVVVLRVPGVGSGILALTFGMMAYGGFLFSMGLYLQTGLGETPLHAGLTMAPAGVIFGLVGLQWRRLPERGHHLVTPIGFAAGGVGYLLLALTLHGGGAGGPLYAALVLLGAGLGLAFTPVVAQSLVNVPAHAAADASGLLTTTFQLSQVIGVAAFGSVFLTMAPHSAAHAISSTMLWGALALLVAAAFACVLAVVVRRQRIARLAEVAGPELVNA